MSDNQSISHVQFMPEKVTKKTSKLKVSLSSGPDSISSRFLTDNVTSLALPLSVLFNKSFQSGVVPVDWRTANVTPIFKKGSIGDPGNYHPISLTSIPCKVKESVMRDEIVDYLVSNQPIKSSQHGFMAYHLCTTNPLEFLETVTKSYDKGEPMDVIYFDFSKAFDKLPPCRLLHKMEALGISGDLLKSIDSWLKDRKQRTVHKGSCSVWADVLSGVPQGSVLGPLLFVIFINDLDECTATISTMMKFEDDMKLGNKATNSVDCILMQQCIDKLIAWANMWCMEFNVKKCKVMHIGKGNPIYQYSMNGTPLQVCEGERDIGVQISNTLKPATKCAEATCRANAILTQIFRAFMYRDRRVFVQLYKQFVRCHLEFSTPAWSPWQAGDIQLLVKVQMTAFRMISG